MQRRPPRLPVFPVPSAGGAGCVYTVSPLSVGWAAPQMGEEEHLHQPWEASLWGQSSPPGTEASRDTPTLLVLPPQCSFCQGSCLSAPLTRQVLLFSNSRSLWKKWQKHQCMKAQLTGGLGSSPPPWQMSLFAVPLCSTIFCQLCLPQASLKSYVTQSWMLLSRVMGELGSDNEGYRSRSIGVSRKEESKGWKGLKNEWEVNTRVLLRTCRPHTSPLLSLLLHLIQLLRHLGEFPWEEESSQLELYDIYLHLEGSRD